MYQRNVNIYKGVDNIIRFTFKNSDQHLINVTGWDIQFNMFSDEEGALVISTPVTAIDANAGVVTATILNTDLVSLDNRYYSYSLTITDPTTGIEQVVYSDDNFGARGRILLREGPYPKFNPSINLSLPTDSNSNITTSEVIADLPTRQLSTQHTAQFYFQTFSGNIDIQSTLDAIPPNGNTSANTSISWSTISSLQFNNQNDTTYYNWNGIFSACRFIITPVTGNVTQILYRA
jgi:hypothetical protein